ncbi:MAG TPA: fluoride efflux transporter CrcB [Acidimicrobiia bacterium]|jgi:CrcB protein|nr:fluoride efflux transporter CrcB [Acidimicrobiia bacterium]
MSTETARSPFATRFAHRPHYQVDLLLAVGLGGGLGTFLRYELSLALPAGSGAFPWAIFVVNVVGALILGFVTTLVLERWPPTRYVRPIVGIGFCGGLTTFSTWMVDTTQLIDAHHALTAVLYVVATLTTGLVALYLGVVTARTLPRRGARP